MDATAPEAVIVDILQKEMGLEADQIWVRNQNRKIPADERIYVVVGMVDTQTLGAQWRLETLLDGNGDAYDAEVQQVQTRESIQIDILGRADDAITRRWEILAGLRSLYSTQKQEAENFKISRIPTTFINTSVAEGGSQLNRFSVTVTCFPWYLKTRALSDTGNQYYDTLNTREDTEKTAGMVHGNIEFTTT